MLTGELPHAARSRVGDEVRAAVHALEASVEHAAFAASLALDPEQHRELVDALGTTVRALDALRKATVTP